MKLDSLEEPSREVCLYFDFAQNISMKGFRLLGNVLYLSYYKRGFIYLKKLKRLKLLLKFGILLYFISVFEFLRGDNILLFNTNNNKIIELYLNNNT